MLPEYTTRWSTVCVHAVSLCNVSDSACLQLTCTCPLLFDSLTVWCVWQMQLRILPESVHKMDYNLYPLLSGLVALPRLKVTVSDRSDVPIRQPQLTELLDRSLPSHVFVMVSMSGFIMYILVLFILTETSNTSLVGNVDFVVIIVINQSKKSQLCKTNSDFIWNMFCVGTCIVSI